MGSTWSLLGASWAQLGCLGRLLGSTFDVLDASWAQLGASWAPLGPSLELYRRLLSSTWRSWTPLGPNLKPLGHLLDASCPPFALPCTHDCAALPGLLSASLCSVHPSVLFALICYFMCELPSELTQQLPVRTKLHLNFHNSYRF